MTASNQYAPETLAYLINLTISEFAPGNALCSAYPSKRRPGRIEISIKDETPVVIVDGYKFLAWLKTPHISWGKIINALKSKAPNNRKDK
ncbi:MAG: hypothetical protein RR250_07445 [Akkermansia sp.]